MSYVNVLSKILRVLKERLVNYGVRRGLNTNDEASREDVEKKMLEELEPVSRALSKELVEISDEEVATLIRRDREDK